MAEMSSRRGSRGGQENSSGNQRTSSNANQGTPSGTNQGGSSSLTQIVPRDQRSSVQVLNDMSNYISRQITVPTQIAAHLIESIRQANSAMERELDDTYEDWKDASTQLRDALQTAEESNRSRVELEKTRTELTQKLTVAETRIRELETMLGKINNDLVAALKMSADFQAELSDRKLHIERQDRIIQDLHHQVQNIRQHEQSTDVVPRVSSADPTRGMQYGAYPPPPMAMYGNSQGVANNRPMMHGAAVQMMNGMFRVEGVPHPVHPRHLPPPKMKIPQKALQESNAKYDDTVADDIFSNQRRPVDNADPANSFARPTRPYEKTKGKNPIYEQETQKAAKVTPKVPGGWSDSDDEPIQHDTYRYPQIMQAQQTNNQAPNAPARGPNRSNTVKTQPMQLMTSAAGPSNTQAAPLQLHTPDADIQNEFTAGFAKQYSLIQGWVQIYASKPQESDVKLAPSYNNPGKVELWNFMMSCTYKNATDAYPHTVALLKDEKSRASLIMRMVVQFLVDRVWTWDVFYGFSEKSDHDLELYRGLLTRREPLNVKTRGDINEKLAEVVQRIVAHTSFEAWAGNRVKELSKAMRDLLLPLLQAGIQKRDAGRGISVFVQHAFDIAVKIHTSHMTFIYVFPECASKFSQSSMIAKQTREAPLDLQLRQARVKLVITPMITMREEKDGAVTACNIHIANVLVMG